MQSTLCPRYPDSPVDEDSTSVPDIRTPDIRTPVNRTPRYPDNGESG